MVHGYEYQNGTALWASNILKAGSSMRSVQVMEGQKWSEQLSSVQSNKVDRVEAALVSIARWDHN